MKGAYLFSMVLLIVLAIPLFADQTLVNPVGEFSAISNNTNEKEVPSSNIELAYDHIAVLNVGIKKTYLPNIGTGSWYSVPLEKNNFSRNYTSFNGGVGRVKKLGRH